MKKGRDSLLGGSLVEVDIDLVQLGLRVTDETARHEQPNQSQFPAFTFLSMPALLRV
jgi:hypothetical protein